MTMRHEWMAAAKTVAYRTTTIAGEAIEEDEIVVGLGTGDGFELLLAGTPKEIALLAERLHHVAARATRAHAEKVQ